MADRSNADQLENRKLNSIETLRGVAALLVIAYHADKYYFLSQNYWQDAILGGLFKFGHAGVEFFFVLSGYLIATIHRTDIGDTGKLIPYIKKRFVRIYPFYWLCLIGAISVFFFVPSFGNAGNRDPINIIGSFFLLGIRPIDAVIFVSWTLFFEVLFYAVFSLAIWKPKFGIITFITWMAGCLIMLPLSAEPIYPLNFISVLFAVGVGAAILQDKVPRWSPELVAALGAVLFLATGVDDAFRQALPRWTQILFYGFGSAMIILGLVAMERAGALKISKLPLLIGQASYAIYLTHMFCLAILAKLIQKLNLISMIPEPAGFIILLSVTVTAGIFIHIYIERNVLRFSRKAIGLKINTRTPHQVVEAVPSTSYR